MHVQQQDADKQAAQEKQQGKEQHMADRWTVERRADVRKAEEQFRECKGSVQRLPECRGGVGLLRALVWSRTGHAAKAKHNKNGAITKEAEVACEAQATSFCPADDDEASQLSAEGSEPSGAEEEGEMEADADAEAYRQGEGEEWAGEDQ